jgi:hypothetical protein
MRGDVDGIGGSVAGDDRLGGLSETAGEPALIDEGAYVPGAEGASGESTGHGLGDVGFAVGQDEAVELSGLALEVDPAPRHLLEIDSALGREAGEPVATLGPAGRGTPLEQSLDVIGMLESAAAIPAAWMLGDDDVVAEDTHGGITGADEHAASDEAVGNRVAIGVQSHASLLGNDGGQHEIGIGRPLGQRAQPRTLDEEPLLGALARRGV